MSRKKPLISVVTITYNHEKYIRKALDSIIQQKTKGKFDLEIIVADDASKDDTSKIIKEYQLIYPKILNPIIRDKNIGIQANLKDALICAKGDYIALCEGDDFWEHEYKLFKQFQLMQENKHYEVSFHPTRVFFENGKYPDTFFPLDTIKYSVENLLTENFIPTNSVMYRKNDYQSLRVDLMPFDWYLHAFHLKNGGEIGFIPETMAAYRRHPKGAWWSSHQDASIFWSKEGPQMLVILKEFRKIFNGNPQSSNGIQAGEYRVATELARHGLILSANFSDNQSKDIILDKFSKAYTDLEQENASLKKKLLLSQQKAKRVRREITMLKKDLKTYMDAYSDLQGCYDSLRVDLKNPLKTIRRFIKHSIKKS